MVGSIPPGPTKDNMQYTDIPNIQRRIVCAANRSKSHPSIILLGPRHWDTSMHTHYGLTELAFSNMPKHTDFEEGFINTWGEFYDRKTAWMIACYNDQIKQFVANQDHTDFGVYGASLDSANIY